MKKHLLSTVLFSTLLVTVPGHADCPFHTDKADKHMTSMKKAPVVQAHSFAAPEAKETWHDLHWFE